MQFKALQNAMKFVDTAICLLYNCTKRTLKQNTRGTRKTMKKLLILMLAAVLALSLAACGGGNDTPSGENPSTSSGSSGHTHTEEVLPAVEATCTESGLTEGKRCSECAEIIVAQETVAALGHTTDTGTCERCGQSLGIWQTAYYVDDFNQPTEDWYVVNNTQFIGTFSNSAVTDAALTADVVIDCEKDIAIFLYEYGRSPVKNASESYVDEYSITMRTEDGADHNMTGTLYCGGDRIYIDDKYIDEVLTALQGEGKVLFRIVNAERTVESYLLPVITSNFADEYAAVTEN
ncbi:hypothetical protein LIZ34_03560 [Intestinimonas butyriciproducens]|uniref:hypothetical protein n=1 Tax=Intestinimonas butyriciproducens TaxID=1297617 RepID=UPI001D07B2DF|nr:hypothetical protein [Intestinimonas butyriciproducens]MCB7049450.1 hypothetical protein [Intestinimonas butyriciproducens]